MTMIAVCGEAAARTDHRERADRRTARNRHAHRGRPVPRGRRDDYGMARRRQTRCRNHLRDHRIPRNRRSRRRIRHRNRPDDRRPHDVRWRIVRRHVRWTNVLLPRSPGLPCPYSFLSRPDEYAPSYRRSHGHSPTSPVPSHPFAPSVAIRMQAARHVQIATRNGVLASLLVCQALITYE